jgi:hypothetical protein
VKVNGEIAFNNYSIRIAGATPISFYSVTCTGGNIARLEWAWKKSLSMGPGYIIDKKLGIHYFACATVTRCVLAIFTTACGVITTGMQG